MIHKFSILILFFLASTTVALSQIAPSPTPVEDKEIIRISSQLVQVDALVLDKNGKQITDLSAEDFEVLQDGKPQKIVNLDYVNSDKIVSDASAVKNKPDKNSPPVPPTNLRSNQGRIITFVIDDGNCLSTIEGMEIARDAVKKFISEQMLPDDRVAIYRTQTGNSLLQLYTSNKEVLNRVVDKAIWYPSNCESAFNATQDKSIFKIPHIQNAPSTAGLSDQLFDPENLDGEVRNPKEEEYKRNSGKYFERDNRFLGTISVLDFVVERLKNLPQRKIVFFVSEGVQAISGSGTYDALKELADKSARSSVVFYTMSAKGLTIPGAFTAADAELSDKVKEERIQEERTLNNGLFFLADSTGGEFVRNKNFLDTSIKKILNQETGYYLIGYQPEEETFKSKEIHKIEVRLKRDDLTISSRREFYGREDAKTKTKEKSADTPLYQAIVSPFQQKGLDVRLTTLFKNTKADGNFIRAIFHLKGEDLTFTDEADGIKKVGLDVVAAVLDEKGKVVSEFNRTYPIKIPSQGVASVMRNGLDYSADIPILQAGFYGLRLAVRDVASRRVGSAGDFVKIPNLVKGEFFMSGLVTTTLSSDGKPLMTKNRPANAAFVPVFANSIPSIRQYAAGDVMAYTFNVYNAKLDGATKKPNLTTQIKLYKNGKVIVEGKETPDEIESQPDVYRLEDYGFLKLNPNAEAGEYILQIIVRDVLTNKTVSQWTDFEVVR